MSQVSATAHKTFVTREEFLSVDSEHYHALHLPMSILLASKF